MGLNYKSVRCLILVFLAALFHPAFNSENYDLFLIEDIAEPIGTTGVRSTGIGSFFPLFLPLLVMMMPMRMPDGTMMTMIQMMMMRMNPAATTSTTTTTTTTTVKPPIPCVPRCPGGFMQLPNPSVSSKCFRRGSRTANSNFDVAFAECSKTQNAILWCPESIAEDKAVRSKLGLGTTTVRIGCNNKNKKMYQCEGTKRTCDPGKPPYGAGDSSSDTKKACVNIEVISSAKDGRNWKKVDCNNKNVFVCEVPIIPCT